MKGHYLSVIKGSMHQEDTIIISIYMPKKSSKIHEENPDMTED